MNVNTADEAQRMGPGGSTPTSSAGAHTHTLTIANTGGNAAHNNVQPSIICNYIIYAGV